MKRAGIYARVSTDEQSDHGYSLPSQIQACQRFVEQRAMSLAGVYQDDLSGTVPIAYRPQGKQLQEAIDKREIDTVVVYQVDRLSRDLIDLMIATRAWLRAGIEIYSLDVGQIKSEFDIVLVIRGWQGSDERVKIVERTSRGRYQKAKQGKVVGSGMPPFGYTFSDGHLFIDEVKAETVRQIFRWYVEGDENGVKLGLKNIALELTKRAIPPPSLSVSWKRARKRDPRFWSIGGVSWILKSETYAGVYHYGKYIGGNGRGGKRPIEDQVAINVPQIISHEVWEATQKQMVINSRNARRRCKREYLLRGMIKCGCGRNMIGANLHYGCNNRYQYFKDLEPVCHEKRVKGAIIEKLVWDYVMGLITDPVDLDEKLHKAQAEELRLMEPKQDELEQVNKLIAQTEQEADNLADGVKRAKGIVLQRLEKASEEVNQKYNDLQARKDSLISNLNAQSFTDEAISNMLNFWKTVQLGLSNPTFEDRRQWLEILQVQVDVKDRKAVVTCRLPVEPFTADLSDIKPEKLHLSPVFQGICEGFSPDLLIVRSAYPGSPAPAPRVHPLT
jgi:site-specific DNA recombinase